MYVVFKYVVLFWKYLFFTVIDLCLPSYFSSKTNPLAVIHISGPRLVVSDEYLIIIIVFQMATEAQYYRLQIIFVCWIYNTHDLKVYNIIDILHRSVRLILLYRLTPQCDMLLFRYFIVYGTHIVLNPPHKQCFVIVFVLKINVLIYTYTYISLIMESLFRICRYFTMCILSGAR